MGDINPSTREEVFMKGIANVMSGNSSGVSITPSSRTEYFLNEILEASGGGGGGGGLPSVTSSDNGDVLTVVNGAWNKAAPSGGGVTVIDFGNDLTAAEIDGVTTFHYTVDGTSWNTTEYVLIYTGNQSLDNVIIAKAPLQYGDASGYEYQLVSEVYSETFKGSNADPNTGNELGLYLTSDAVAYTGVAYGYPIVIAATFAVGHFGGEQ